MSWSNPANSTSAEGADQTSGCREVLIELRSPLFSPAADLLGVFALVFEGIHLDPAPQRLASQPFMEIWIVQLLV